MIPNQYDDDILKSQLEGLINRKMVDIVRVATKERARCEEYTAIDMSVNSLAVWHSSLGLHARWVLGVTHGKDEGCKETQILQPRRVRQSCRGGVCVKHGARVKSSSQDGSDNQVQQGGVCVKHGARVAERRRKA